MKKNKYHTVETFQNPIKRIVKRGKNRNPTQKLMTTHFPGLIQTLQEKVAGLSYFYGLIPLLLEN